MTDRLPQQPEMEPLTRVQVLVAMGVTAIVLLLVAKLWLQFGKVPLLAIDWKISDMLLGIALGFAITAASSLVYRFWAAYRQSANLYLTLVLKPLVWPDLIWLGLLPGMSEELLFRGVMLSAFGLNAFGLICSSLLFGILHLSSPRQWPYAVWAASVGFLLGFSVWATGNLLVPILAHITANLVSSLLWKLGDMQTA